MTTMLKRLSYAAFFVAAALLAVVPATQAATTFKWTDLSAKLNVRKDRPVWAVAYASPYWYMTDGQELYAGGHVWRTDGTNVKDITVEVRNAGLSRVDDIVSDGSTVLYLKNIARRNNSFEILSYKNGAYGYPAYSLTSMLSADEGIASIQGKNGTWAVVTTYGRILFWDGMSSNVSTMNVGVSTNLSDLRYRQNMPYSLNGSGTYLPITTSPVNGGWLVTVQDFNSSLVRAYKRLDNGSWNEVTQLFSQTGRLNFFLDRVSFASSNGNTVFLGGVSTGLTNNQAWWQDTVYTYDGNTAKLITLANKDQYRQAFDYLNNAQVAWTGSSWMIVGSGKNVARFDGSTFSFFGRRTEFFTSFASNGKGTVIVGGTNSNLTTFGPTSPLSARLFKVAESVTSAPATPVATVTSHWSWVEPFMTTIRRDQTTTYNVGAWNQKNVKRIEMMVNGVTQRVCEANVATLNCNTTIYGNNFSAGTQLTLVSKVTDYRDQVVWTQPIYLSVADALSSNPNPSTDVSAWLWTEPTGSTLGTNETRTVRVQANGSDGLTKIEVYANNNLLRTCNFGRVYGTQSCDTTVYGNSYSYNQTVTLNARATDWSGRTAWSSNLILNANGSNTGTNYNSVVRYTATPDKNDLQTNEDVNYTAFAIDANGLKTIEVYVNGSLYKSCPFTGETYERACSVSLTSSSYAQGSDLVFTAKATDSLNNVIWVPSRTWRINGSSTGGSNNGETASWISSSPEITNLGANQSTVFTASAYDADGISRIQLWVNGQIPQDCAFDAWNVQTRSCSFTVQSNNYPNGTGVFVNAKIWDRHGNVSWSNSKTYQIVR